MLTVEEKRAAVAALLADPAWSGCSDRAIARQLQVSQPFVGKMRRLLSAAKSNIPELPQHPAAGDNAAGTLTNVNPGANTGAAGDNGANLSTKVYADEHRRLLEWAGQTERAVPPYEHRPRSATVLEAVRAAPERAALSFSDRLNLDRLGYVPRFSQRVMDDEDARHERIDFEPYG